MVAILTLKPENLTKLELTKVELKIKNYPIPHTLSEGRATYLRL